MALFPINLFSPLRDPFNDPYEAAALAQWYGEQNPADLLEAAAPEPPPPEEGYAWDTTGYRPTWEWGMGQLAPRYNWDAWGYTPTWEWGLGQLVPEPPARPAYELMLDQNPYFGGSSPYSLGLGGQPLVAPSAGFPTNNPLQAAQGMQSLQGGPPAPGQTRDSFEQSVFGELLDSVKSVSNALRKRGISPVNGNPAIKHLVNNAADILAPLYVQLAENPDLINDTVGLIGGQVDAYLAGRPTSYTPTAGRQALNTVLAAAKRGQDALALNGGEGAVHPGLQLLAQVMAEYGGATGVLSGLVTGGLPGRMANLINRSYQTLPELAEFIAATQPGARQESVPSFLDLIFKYGR